MGRHDEYVRMAADQEKAAKKADAIETLILEILEHAKEEKGHLTISKGNFEYLANQLGLDPKDTGVLNALMAERISVKSPTAEQVARKIIDAALEKVSIGIKHAIGEAFEEYEETIPNADPEALWTTVCQRIRGFRKERLTEKAHKAFCLKWEEFQQAT